MFKIMKVLQCFGSTLEEIKECHCAMDIKLFFIFHYENDIQPSLVAQW